MTQRSEVVTRFAPSPTGYLHIGGARTALYNWLYARHHGGRFLLRIEDTDRERSTQEAIDAILSGLTWFGLDWDEDPIYQYARSDRHREIAEELMAKGQAYPCYTTPEELAELREKAKEEKKNFTFQSPWRDTPAQDRPADKPFVVRLKSPLEGETVINDEVQGEIAFPNSQLDDMVLLRSDGTPTYMLAVVVDDHDMGITHIIRGDDHLTNAARQTLIYDALGWQAPVFAHISLIHGEDGAKLSKRHGALGVEAYEEMGFLPEALRNYLLRLGWSHGDAEIISTQKAIEWFDFGGLNKAAARLDRAKLEHVNGTYITNTDNSKLTILLNEYYLKKGVLLSDDQKAKIEQLMPELKERAKTLIDLADGANFLVTNRPLAIEDKAAKLLKKEGAREILADLYAHIAGEQEWSKESIETCLKGFAEQKAIGFGKVAQPLRAAVTGSTTAPGIYEVLWVLGKDETLARMADQKA